MCNRCVYSLIQRVLLADTMMQSMQSYDSKNKQVRYVCCLSELISLQKQQKEQHTQRLQSTTCCLILEPQRTTTLCWMCVEEEDIDEV